MCHLYCIIYTLKDIDISKRKALKSFVTANSHLICRNYPLSGPAGDENSSLLCAVRRLDGTLIIPHFLSHHLPTIMHAVLTFMDVRRL